MADLVFGIIGTILYPLFSIIFIAIDAVQDIFRSFAGIGSSYFGSGGNMIGGTTIGAGNSGAENDTGLVYFLLNHSLVKNMVMSIMLLAFFLIIIFTVFAFIKNIYAAKPKSWKEIVLNSLKGMGNFILLPVLVLLGVWIGNIILNAIDGATSHGGAVKMSRQLFMTSAYNANIYRNSNGGLFNDPYEKVSKLVERFDLDITVEKNQSDEYYAGIVDQVYAETNISIYDWVTVGNFYNLYQINYLILVVGGIFMLYLLGQLTAGMVKRLFNLILYFIVSPVTCAMYPIDEGAATKSWAGEVKKTFLSVYGAVAGMNIFYSILPLIENITIGSNALTASLNSTLINDIAQLFIMTIGLDMVKGFVTFVNGLIGGGDPWGSLKEPYNKIKKYGKKAIKVGSMTTHYFNGAFKSMANLGGAAGSTVSSWFKGAGAAASNAWTGMQQKAWESKERRNKKKEYKKLFDEADIQDYQNNTGTEESRKRGAKLFAKERRRAERQHNIDNAKTVVKDAWQNSRLKHGIDDLSKKAADAKVARDQKRWDAEQRRNKKKEYEDVFADADVFAYQNNTGTEEQRARGAKKLAKEWRKAERRHNIDNAKDKASGVANKLGNAIGKAGAWVGDKATNAGKAVSGFAKSQVEAAKNSDLATMAGVESKNFAKGVASLGRTIYAETGLDKAVSEYTDEWTGARKRIADRDKEAAKGKYGINDAIKTAKEFMPDDAHIESMSSHLLNALGDKISSSFFKAFMQSGNSAALRNALGFNDKTSEADMKYFDSILQKLEHYQDRINDKNQTKDQRQEWIDAAKKFTMETDSKGNANLQKALNEAFKLFAEKNLKVKGEVKLDQSSTISALTKASKQGVKDMAKFMVDYFKDVLKQLDKDNKK